MVRRCQTRARHIQSRIPTLYRCQIRAWNIQCRMCSQILLVSNEGHRPSIFDRHFRTIFPTYLPMTACERHSTNKGFCNGFFQDGQNGGSPLGSETTRCRTQRINGRPECYHQYGHISLSSLKNWHELTTVNNWKYPSRPHGIPAK
jgi:hypothetical protein